MQYAKMKSVGRLALDFYPLTLEVSILPGFHRIEFSGSADPQQKEAQNRVRAALINNQYKVPNGRIMINFSPAENRKNTTIYDLAMALALLQASRQIAAPSEAETWALAELGLDGQLKAVEDLFVYCRAAVELGAKRLILAPTDDPDILSLADRVELYLCTDLQDACNAYLGLKAVSVRRKARPKTAGELSPALYDGVLRDLLQRLPEAHFKALCLAAAGWHPLLLYGSQIHEKKSRARLLRALLPPLEVDDYYYLRSLQNLLNQAAEPGAEAQVRPFCEPHFSSSVAALLGGGSPIRPGLLCTAHRGVLFLDELFRYKREVLKQVAVTLLNKRIEVSKFRDRQVFPVDCLAVMAMTPCHCGQYFENERPCNCSLTKRQQHRQRVPVELWEYLDIAVICRSQQADEASVAETPEAVQERLLAARTQIAAAWAAQFSRARAAGLAERLNAAWSLEELELYAAFTPKALAKVRRHAAARQYSYRRRQSLLALARTVADWAAAREVQAAHCVEAIQWQEALNAV